MNATANFLLLRIFLALSVVFPHFAEISGRHGFSLFGMSSTIAVQAFFVISGWIVTQSFDRSASLTGFWIRRFARLYPLYAVAICLQALIASVLASDFGMSEFAELGRYLVVNLAFANFLQPSLFGLLDAAPVKAINPALWTLKIEVTFYLFAPLFVLFYRARGLRGLILMYVATAVFYYLAASRSELIARQFVGQLRFFVAGMLCWRLAALGFGHGRSRWLLAAVAALGLYAGHFFEHDYLASALQPLAVALFVYAAAHCLPEPRTLPDVSYGVYIVHAPLLQFAFLLDLLPADGVGLALAIEATLIVAAISWYGLERPALELARRISLRLERRRAHLAELSRTAYAGRAPNP